MVLAFIAVAIGILIVVVLIYKVIKTPSHEAISLDVYCKKCGFKTNGLKCPKCEQRNSFGV